MAQRMANQGQMPQQQRQTQGQMQQQQRQTQGQMQPNQGRSQSQGQGQMQSSQGQGQPKSQSQGVDPSKFQNDVNELQKVGISINDISELGNLYIILRSMGVMPIPAYSMLEEERSRIMAEITVAPPTMGTVNSSGQVSKDYYSPEEVDRLSKDDLADENVLLAVKDSMTKWR